MNYNERQQVFRPITVIAGMAVLLLAGVVPAFAEGTSQLPLAPTNLAAIPVSSNQITLVWNPPQNATQTDITGYQILQNGQVLVNDTGNTLTNYNETSLLPGTTEQYQVGAWSPEGLGLLSGTASATTEASSPSQVTPVPTNGTQTSQEPPYTTPVETQPVDTTPVITEPTYVAPTNNQQYFVNHWRDYLLQHHAQLASHGMLGLQRAHLFQTINDKNPFVGQQNQFDPAHWTSHNASSPPHQWISQTTQYQIHQTQTGQQFKGFSNGAQTWAGHALPSAYGHQTDPTGKQIPDWNALKAAWDH